MSTPDVLAVDTATRRLVRPQPDASARDDGGHFRGCSTSGCEVTRCRERGVILSQRGWMWTAIYPAEPDIAAAEEHQPDIESTPGAMGPDHHDLEGES